MPSTEYAISEFQRRILHLPNPDGRIDPGGCTLVAPGGAPGMMPGEPVLDGKPLPIPAAKVLREILKAAGLARATVTSVSRTPFDQARVMYNNCLLKGVQLIRTCTLRRESSD